MDYESSKLVATLIIINKLYIELIVGQFKTPSNTIHPSFVTKLKRVLSLFTCIHRMAVNACGGERCIRKSIKKLQLIYSENETLHRTGSGQMIIIS